MVSYPVLSVLQNIRIELCNRTDCVFHVCETLRDIRDSCDVCDMCDSCDV